MVSETWISVTFFFPIIWGEKKPKHFSLNNKIYFVVFLLSLISRMLQKDPTRRASLDEIEAHRWLQDLDDVLLSPEAPPHWVSGALGATFSSSGAPECGDLLAARPAAAQAAPRVWQPSFTLRPAPVEEPPATKNLPALQQICEEEDEEEEEEGGFDKDSDVTVNPGGEDEKMLEGLDNPDCREEEGRAEMRMQKENEDSGCVISDQPVSHWDETLSDAPSSLSGFGVPCWQADLSNGEEEPNNNTEKPDPVLHTSESSHSRASASSTSLKDTTKTEKEEPNKRTSTERSGPHSPQGTRDELAPKAEQGKRHSIKLRERLFQFPLCEKALAFNIPTNKKPKILPLAQYNCCHVL